MLVKFPQGNRMIYINPLHVIQVFEPDDECLILPDGETRIILVDESFIDISMPMEEVVQKLND